MRFAAFAAALAALPAAFATINIAGPSSSSYWVQNTSNVITWSFSSGDPSPVNIVVVNPDNTTLNGPFSISNYVDLSNSSFTVTNVTLRVGSGYQVVFVNPLNTTQVYASSQSFQVMAPGTAAAPTASVAPASTTGSGSPSGSASGSSPSGTSPSSTASGSGSGSAAPAPTNGASALGVSSVFTVLAACGAAAVAVLL